MDNAKVPRRTAKVQGVKFSFFLKQKNGTLGLVFLFFLFLQPNIYSVKRRGGERSIVFVVVLIELFC